MTLVLLVALLGAQMARAEGEKAGDFDYYVMSLSWSSGWCAGDKSRLREPQCAAGQGLTFVLHGLWPQYETGWPSYCRTVEHDPARSETAKVADLMGGAGYAFYQWKKHGRCSGLAAPAYYQKARAAYDTITIPPVFAKMTKRLSVPAEVVEGAFLESNPGLARDQVTVTCEDGRIDEVRICLTKDLKPRRCGRDTLRDCRLKDAVLEPLR